jgi:hypothetical protein
LTEGIGFQIPSLDGEDRIAQNAAGAGDVVPSDKPGEWSNSVLIVVGVFARRFKPWGGLTDLCLPRNGSRPALDKRH